MSAQRLKVMVEKLIRVSAHSYLALLLFCAVSSAQHNTTQEIKRVKVWPYSLSFSSKIRDEPRKKS